MQHPWIIRHTRASSRMSISSDTFKQMTNFSNASKIQQIALNCIAHLCGNEEVSESNKLFKSIDINGDGYITLRELKEVLKDKYDDSVLQNIIRSIDADKNGAINYTEFIAATLKTSVVADE